MAERDSAFLWETEALRSARPEPRPRSGVSEGWVTLREASELTGIPVSTIRKWALRQTIASRLDATPTGQIRMVTLGSVYERARRLGREVEAPKGPSDRPAEKPSAPAQPTESPGPQPEIPEGSMLVPLDAWTKVLNQLGNLHDAGQQLAEARERAAKAETEAAFLRERLAELRAQLAGSIPEPDDPGPPEPPRSSTWSAVSGVWAALRKPKKPKSG